VMPQYAETTKDRYEGVLDNTCSQSPRNVAKPFLERVSKLSYFDSSGG
jgi:hypothetical protein